eukprot:12045775-Ditylum_brightwellii.AAC.1
MDNLAYTATTSSNVVEELVRTSSKLVEQLIAVQEENNRLLKINELSVTQGRNTAAILHHQGKTSITDRRSTMRQRMYSWSQNGIACPADIMCQKIT